MGGLYSSQHIGVNQKRDREMNRTAMDKKTAKTKVKAQAKPEVLYVLFHYWRNVVQELLVLILSGKEKWEV
jgi:hypothetical protein